MLLHINPYACTNNVDRFREAKCKECGNEHSLTTQE